MLFTTNVSKTFGPFLTFKESSCQLEIQKCFIEIGKYFSVEYHQCCLKVD